MTFIASVIAKKGVAVIADSLVTSMNRVITYENFLELFAKKAKETPIQDIKITPDEIGSLFERKSSHTKDYEEKLFEYDKYTAITTAGAAIINDKRIESIINDILIQNKADKGYVKKKIETKVKEFSDFINKQAIEHINSYDEIGYTMFLWTHYNKKKEKTFIFKIEILPSSKTDIVEGFNCVSFKQVDEYYRVVCDGQNRISERMLFGEVDFFVYITPKIVNKVIETLKIPPEQVPENYVSDFLKNAQTFLPQQFYDDIKMNKLAELSLQQAVDLAALLMKIEINFQKYTENIPSVGGVIKLAIINKDGFKFISGNEILKPENLN